MTTDRDDPSVRRYREANEALDERPSAATRAAILAAAARQVEAKPRAADAPRAVHRRRWPVAAAAAVLLSTLAVMMAQRTEQEMPSFTAPPAQPQEQSAVAHAPAPESGLRATPPAASAAPSASSSDSPATTAKRPDAQPRAPDQSTARSKQGAPPPSVNERASVPSARSGPSDAPAMAADTVQRSAPRERESEAASAEARNAFPAAPAAAPPPPAVARSAPAPSAQGELNAGSGAGAASDSVNSNRAARREAAPAQMPKAVARNEPARDFERSAQEWLDHIVKLRGEGRHAEADIEVKRFRERYPEVQLPAAALAPAPTGTR